MESGERQFNEDELYEQFPHGDRDGFGTSQGFNRWVRINDERLFTPEALEIPAIRAFVDAPFAVSYAQFKSSHRETEFFLHKPHLAMSGQVSGIEGTVEGVSERGDTAIATLVLNHHRSLAYHILRTIAVSTDDMAGQITVKETP